MDRFTGMAAIALLVCSLACDEKESEPTAPSSSLTGAECVFVPKAMPLTAPPGWVVVPHPSKQGRMLVSPDKQDGFAPCINLLEEQDAGSLDRFVDLSVATLREYTEKFRQLKREPFATDSGVTGIKLTCTSVTGKVQLHFCYYLFDWTADSKRVFTCCSLASQAKTMEPVFDGILKTYRPE
jgi:hypothetical protein